MYLITRLKKCSAYIEHILYRKYANCCNRFFIFIQNRSALTRSHQSYYLLLTCKKKCTEHSYYKVDQKKVTECLNSCPHIDL